MVAEVTVVHNIEDEVSIKSIASKNSVSSKNSVALVKSATRVPVIKSNVVIFEGEISVAL